MEASLQVPERRKVLVLDTSFFMRHAEGQLWTREPFKAIKDPDYGLVVPADVQHEYNSLMNGSYRQHSSQLHTIDGILGADRVQVYKEDLRQAFSEKLDRDTDPYGRKHNTLTLTDKKVIQAALDNAIKGNNVFVASSDWAIISEVEGLEIEHNLDMSHYSPWSPPQKQDGLDFLMTGSVFNELPKMHETSGSSPRYLAVAKNQHVGGGSRYDVIFGIYVNRNFALAFPRIDGVYYIRLYPMDIDNPSVSIGVVKMYIDMMAHPIFGAYNSENPESPVLFSVKSPINLLQKKKLIDGFKKGMTGSQLKSISSEKMSISDAARIEEDDIERHDKVAATKLQEMKRKLNGNNGNH